MKVYFHFDGSPQNPEFTKVIRVEGSPKEGLGGMTVADALAWFLKAYQTKHPEQSLHQALGHLVVRNSKGKPVALDSHMVTAFSDRDDAFVCLELGVGPVTAGDDLSPKDLAVHPGAAVMLSEQPQGSKVCAAPRAEVDEALLQAATSQAETAVKAGNLRAAAGIYQHLLQLDQGNARILIQYARLWLQAGNGVQAAACARLAVQSLPDDSRVLQLLGEAHL